MSMTLGARRRTASTQIGTLIVARHAMEKHEEFLHLWQEQVEGLKQRLEPYLPNDRQRAVILTSPKERAAAVADFLHRATGVEKQIRNELPVGSQPVVPEKVAKSVATEMRNYQLVVAISHEPVCKRLALDTWRRLGMRMITPPNFEDYTSAVVIDPRHAPDFAWDWTTL